jgi:tetratricopeptide (TPR) repeat protein
MCVPGAARNAVGLAVSQAGVDQLPVAQADVARGDFKAAESILRQYTLDDPKSADAGFLLGYVLLRLDRPKESLAEYTRAAALRTPTADDLKNVAEDYVLLNDLTEADQRMLQATKMDEKDPGIWYGLGRIRYSEQRFRDAVVCFQKTLALAPRSVKAEDNLGLAYQALNQLPEAIRAFQLALEWQKDAPHPSEQPMLNLAIAYLEQHQPDDALPLLIQAVAIAPKDPRIHDKLGQLYLEKNQLADAQREFEAATALAPENAAYHFLLGRALHRLGREADAKAEFARAAELNGTHSTPESH